MNTTANNSINELQRRYRQIDAPPFLASRTMASLPDKPASRRWMPAVATVALVLLIVGVAPQLMDREVTGVPATSPLSLAALSRMTPDRPLLASPSMSRLRTVKSPPLPAKPVIQPATDPQSRLQIIITDSKEPNHA